MNRGPNQVVESRVATAANVSSVSSSTAATGRPTRASGPRCITAQPGEGCCSTTLSTSGLSATSHVALPSPTECGQSPAAAGVDCGRTNSRRDAVAARTR